MSLSEIAIISLCGAYANYQTSNIHSNWTDHPE